MVGEDGVETLKMGGISVSESEGDDISYLAQ
jgi:hypothetical protein